ncbi:hypothetical protein CASFOL_006888 [Castilleja foliolosa]|uniref:Protein phosphatase inhibitor 2 n=1 Tax=Castilleja foliolosa TaxID=1961234 RepID=A0ABD3EBJ8_9LAMI
MDEEKRGHNKIHFHFLSRGAAKAIHIFPSPKRYFPDVVIVRGLAWAPVKWDEDNIAEIEANKPVRQKITEPKTPYHPMIDVDDDDDDDSSSHVKRGSSGNSFEDAMHAEAIRSALNDVGSSSKTGVHHSGWTSSEDDIDATDQNEEGNTEGSETERRKIFREQRKAHYDEFRKVKQLRRQGSLLENETDEETENGKERGPRVSSSMLKL